MDALKQMKIAGLELQGIIHIGANNGQERYAYEATGVKPVIYVEPIDAVFELLKQHISGMDGHQAIQALCSNQSGEEVRFNISSNNGESSSMLPLGPHEKFFPDIKYTMYKEMITTTVDSIMKNFDEKPNLIVIDTQGADLKVLQGAVISLNLIFDAVYVEVSETPLYTGGCTFNQVSNYLFSFGFVLRWLKINAWGHGNAFFCKPI